MARYFQLSHAATRLGVNLADVDLGERPETFLQRASSSLSASLRIGAALSLAVSDPLGRAVQDDPGAP